MAADVDEVEDAAAQAFEGVRAEIALLRRAIERLAAERAAAETPDYTVTLGQITKATAVTARAVDALIASPALALTPQETASQIANAAVNARSSEQKALAEARLGLVSATRELQGYLAAARGGDEQNRWLVGMAVGGLAVGALLWAALAGPVARVVPETWLWPERMAARTLNRSMWDAGQRLMTVVSPESWKAIVEGDRIVEANKTALDGCRKAAASARKAVKCTIRVGQASQP